RKHLAAAHSALIKKLNALGPKGRAAEESFGEISHVPAPYVSDSAGEANATRSAFNGLPDMRAFSFLSDTCIRHRNASNTRLCVWSSTRHERSTTEGRQREENASAQERSVPTISPTMQKARF